LHVEKLSRQHKVEAFDCGVEPLNQFLTRFALMNQAANAAQTYVALDGETIAGFYTLVVGEVEHVSAPERLRKGLSRLPIPIMILARLAVEGNRQGRRLGHWLLKGAIVRSLRVADIAGMRALVVHAKDEKARAFYEKFGFTQGFSDPLHLYVLTKELKALVA
jgi:GNAT superfamily N-acetyltransferase